MACVCIPKPADVLLSLSCIPWHVAIPVASAREFLFRDWVLCHARPGYTGRVVPCPVEGHSPIENEIKGLLLKAFCLCAFAGVHKTFFGEGCEIVFFIESPLGESGAMAPYCAWHGQTACHRRCGCCPRRLHLMWSQPVKA